MEHQHGAHHSHDGSEEAPALLEIALSVHSLLPQIEELAPPVPAAPKAFLMANDPSSNRMMVSGVFHPPRIG